MFKTLSLLLATAAKGADIVIGFTTSIQCLESDIWVEAFFEALGSGSTVRNAMSHADKAVEKDWDGAVTTSESQRHYVGNIDQTIEK